MKKYVIVLITVVILVLLALYFNVPSEHFFANLEADITSSNKLPKKYAGAPTEAELFAGAHTYRKNCALCHGLPNRSRTVIARGMSPRPPEFFKPTDGTSYNSSLPFKPATWKVYRKVKYGVGHTGMPSFKSGLKDNQMWELSQFLSNARNLPPNVIAVLEGKSEKRTSSSSAPKTRSQIASAHK